MEPRADVRIEAGAGELCAISEKRENEMTTIAQQLDNVLALAEKATGGVWSADDHKDWHQPQTDIRSDNGTKIARFVKGDPQFWCTVGKAEYEWANAEFIAAACNFIREHGPAIRAAVGAEAVAKYRHSTHYVHRGPAQGFKEPESLPCYCPATSDHAIGKEGGDPAGPRDDSDRYCENCPAIEAYASPTATVDVGALCSLLIRMRAQSSVRYMSHNMEAALDIDNFANELAALIGEEA